MDKKTKQRLLIAACGACLLAAHEPGAILEFSGNLWELQQFPNKDKKTERIGKANLRILCGGNAHAGPLRCGAEQMEKKYRRKFSL